MASRPWLLCDADDTLWENNIFFEQVIQEFIVYLDHPQLSPVGVRRELDRIEARNVKVNGYGTDNFGRNLIECFELLQGQAASPRERARMMELTERIHRAPMTPMPGVEETLDALCQRFRLALVTKGDLEEQAGKLSRSGLEERFERVFTAREKDAGLYRRVSSELGVDAASTWMIGNSPRSDIIPALEAGLGAVLVPNQNTWSLEMQEIPGDHPRCIVVRRFSDLTEIL